jgi:hypothetical protein
MLSLTTIGPTAAVTTTDGKISAGTYTFSRDGSNDMRSLVYSITATGGTQAGVQKHTAEAPKQFIVRRPANYAQPSNFNSVSGKYGKVPNNVTRITGRGSAKISATQWAAVPISMDIGVPAGATSYDPDNVEASFMMFIAALYDQKEEICQAIIDGQYGY